MENNQTTRVVIVQSKKSMGIALILTLFFGPLGMFYSTVGGAIAMILLTPIIGIITLGVGLIVMWPIQLIWTAIAVSSHNNEIDAAYQSNESNTPPTHSNTQENQSNDKEECAPVAAKTKDNIRHYNDANGLSDSKIEEMLSKENELSNDFIEALKFVRKERTTERELSNNRKLAFSGAMQIDEQERKSRIDSPSLYSASSISALTYIQRCIECDIEPTENGFLLTFEEGYVAPETQKEREQREQQEAEQAKRIAEINEVKRKRAEEAALEEAKQKKRNIVALILVIVTFIAVGIYVAVIEPNNLYNEKIARCDAQFHSIINNNNLQNKENELIMLKRRYEEISIPLAGTQKKLAYISEKTSAIDNQIIKDKGFYSITRSPSNCEVMNITTDNQYTKIKFKYKSRNSSTISLKTMNIQYYTNNESKKLKMIKAENIALYPKKEQYKSGDLIFYLYFEPIPEGVSKCDIVGVGSWSWTNIELYTE